LFLYQYQLVIFFPRLWHSPCKAEGNTNACQTQEGAIMETSYPADLSSSIEFEAEDATNARDEAQYLRNELADLKRDLDALLAKAGAIADREIRTAWSQLNGQFGNAQGAARDMAGQASEQFSRGVDVTSDYVREKPMQAIAIAAGVGLLIGMLRR
jgi:ElaB/YqjD/DUF883 family membrane-anchored ribosome-binding protein